jgi:DNA-binding beta-propeller fold protein YncE
MTFPVFATGAFAMTCLKTRLRHAGVALLSAGSLLALAAPAVLAQAPFTSIDSSAEVNVSFAAVDPSNGILAGGDVRVTGRGFDAGQEVEILFGDTPLTASPLVADAEGNLSGAFSIPASAVPGNYPVAVLVRQPYVLELAQLKVSPTVPLSGAENYAITEGEVTRGQYQSAYSSNDNMLFVTASVGRPPIRESELLKLDGTTLEVVARVAPPEAPAPAAGARGPGGPGGGDAAADTRPPVYGVYGIGLDETNDTVWVTNTRQNTVAVFNQSDLSLVKQFPDGTVQHSRDVQVDGELGRAFASAGVTPNVEVFDTATLEKIATITIPSNVRGEQFGAMSLSLDRRMHRLYVAGLPTSEVAVIDTRTNEVLNVFAVPGAEGVIGVSHDPVTNRIYVSAQVSDSVFILDGESGDLIRQVPVGAGTHNVAVDPEARRVYAESRIAGTITVLDMDGNILANLGGMPRVNHIEIAGNGVIYAVDKSVGVTQAETDVLYRIEPR